MKPRKKKLADKGSIKSEDSFGSEGLTESESSDAEYLAKFKDRRRRSLRNRNQGESSDDS